MKGHVYGVQDVKAMIKECALVLLCFALGVWVVSCSIVPESSAITHENDQDLIRYQVGGGDKWFLEGLATYGIDSRKKMRRAVIVLRPTIIKHNGNTQTRIPDSFDQAVHEIRKALPRWYLRELQWRKGQIDTNEYYCESNDLMIDEMIVLWMIHYWEIEALDYDDDAMNLDPRGAARYMAELIFEQLCE